MANTIILSGKTKGELQTRTLESGKDVSKISLDVARYNSKGRDFFTVKFWGAQAEKAQELLTREGQMILVTGKHTNDRYEKDGVWHDMWTVHATDLEVLGAGAAAEAPAKKKAQETDEIPF